MNVILFNEILVWMRVPPLVLFLVQYRGRSPVAWMLRGCVVTMLGQAATATVALMLSKSISPIALILAIGSHGMFAVWAWAFYLIYLRYRKTI